MAYSRIRPHPALVPFIEEILIQDPVSDAEAAPFKVLPRPFPVIGFQYQGRLEVLRESRADLLARSGITGLQTTFRWFRPLADARSVLVVLKPYGAFPLLGCSMRDVADAHIPLDAILPPAYSSSTEDRIAEACVKELAGIVQSFFLGLLERSRRDAHPVVVEASQRILAAHGNGSVESLARDLAISRRQMERLFQLQIGVGPKELASLARFDWVLRRLPDRASWADLAYEAGYADQSHFIRSFALRAGTTPGDVAFLQDAARFPPR